MTNRLETYLLNNSCPRIQEHTRNWIHWLYQYRFLHVDMGLVSIRWYLEMRRKIGLSCHGNKETGVEQNIATGVRNTINWLRFWDINSALYWRPVGRKCILAYGARDWNWNWPIKAQYAGQTEFSYVIRRKDPGNEGVACSVEHRVCVRLPATPVILVRCTFICMNAGKQVLILMKF